MKKVSAFFLLVIVSATGYADEIRTSRSNIDHNSASRKANIALPPLITEKYKYYDVCGCSEKELGSELIQKAIIWNDGKKYDSITNWKVKWDYSPVRSSDGCFADAFRLIVDILVVLPNWIPSGPAPQYLMDRWGNYIKELTMHEHGHRDRVRVTAAEITRAVGELAPAGSCEELDRQVRVLCRAHMDKLDEDQRAYDAVTGHGFAHGIAFP